VVVVVLVVVLVIVSKLVVVGNKSVIDELKYVIVVDATSVVCELESIEAELVDVVKIVVVDVIIDVKVVVVVITVCKSVLVAV
jgi:hypothetical protein